MAADRRDVREGGRWTAAQALKNHVVYAAVVAVLFALRPLSPRALARLGRLVGRALFVLARPPRRVALENLARVFPELPPRARVALAHRSFVTLGECLGTAVAQLVAPGEVLPLPFADGSLERLREALQEGNGVLFVTAHLGPWERLALSLVDAGMPLTTLAREGYDPRLSRLYDAMRGGAGVGVIYRGQPTSAVRIVRTLRRGELLGVPMDLRSRVPSVPVPFLGHDADVAVGPARIALAAGAAVVVGTVAPSPGGLVIDVTRVPLDGLAGVDGAARLTARLASELSSRIRAFPEGWVWMHPRWTSREQNEIRSLGVGKTRYTPPEARPLAAQSR